MLACNAYWILFHAASEPTTRVGHLYSVQSWSHTAANDYQLAQLHSADNASAKYDRTNTTSQSDSTVYGHATENKCLSSANGVPLQTQRQRHGLVG
jgi:hypothetical protein